MNSESQSDPGLLQGEDSSSVGHTLGEDDYASMLVLGNASDVCFTDTNPVFSTADEEVACNSCKSSFEIISELQRNEVDAENSIMQSQRDVSKKEGFDDHGGDPSSRTNRHKKSSPSAVRKNRQGFPLPPDNFSTKDYTNSDELIGSRSPQKTTETMRNGSIGDGMHAEGALQLDLNAQNLHDFKATVERGNPLPLRTDFVDRRDYPTVSPNAVRKGEKNVAFNEEISNSDCNGSLSIRSQGMPTIALSNSVEAHCYEKREVGSSTSDFHRDPEEKYAMRGLTRAGMKYRGTTHASSPPFHFHRPSSKMPSVCNPNTLNANNLNRHIKILSSGAPAKLWPENMRGWIDEAEIRKSDTRKGHVHDVGGGNPSCENSACPCSLRVEKHMSESSMAGMDSRSPLTEGSPKISEGDMWSVQSVADRGFSDFITDSNRRSLSIENLLQLKRELQSNSVPLRPELLAGLEMAVKAMSAPPPGGTSSDGEQSLLVASSGNATREVTTVDAERSQMEGELESKLMDVRPDLSFELDGPHDSGTGPGGLSFHSMLVEAAPTEVHEAKEDESSRSGYVHTLNELEEHSNEALPEEDEEDDKMKFFSDEDEFRDHSCSSNFSYHEETETMECCPMSHSAHRNHKRLNCTAKHTPAVSSPIQMAKGESTTNVSSHSSQLLHILQSMESLLKKLNYELMQVIRSQNGLEDLLRRCMKPASSILPLSTPLSDECPLLFQEAEQRPISLTVRLRPSSTLKKDVGASGKGGRERKKEEIMSTDSGSGIREGTHLDTKENSVHNAQDGERNKEDRAKERKSSGEDEVIEFLFPFHPHATVGQCKETALQRLQRIRILDIPTDTTAQVLFFYRNKFLFDEDTLFNLGINTGDTVELKVPLQSRY